MSLIVMHLRIEMMESLTDDEVRVEITAWKYNSEPYKK